VDTMASSVDRVVESLEAIASEPLDAVTANHVDTIVSRILARESDEAAIAVAAFGSSL
jgi:hypothetical protein